MAKWTLIFSIIVLLLAGCQQSGSPKSSNDIVLTRLNGHKVHLKQLQDKQIVLNYWASWCKPCYEEIPELNAFAKDHQDEVMVLGVSYDQVEPDQIPKLEQKMNIQFPTLKYNPAQQLGIKQVPGLPATYIISPQGNIKKRLLGQQTEKSLEQATGL